VGTIDLRSTYVRDSPCHPDSFLDNIHQLNSD
jgi:hypothetical protein